MRDNLEDFDRYYDDLRRSFDELRTFAKSQSREHLRGMLFVLWNEILHMESLQSSDPNLPIVTNEDWRIAKVAKYSMLILAFQNTTTTDAVAISRGGATIELPSGKTLTVNSSEEEFERFARTLPRFTDSDSTPDFVKDLESKPKGCFSVLLCAFTVCVLIIICCFAFDLF